MTWQLYTALIAYSILVFLPITSAISTNFSTILDDGIVAVVVASSVVLDSCYIMGNSSSRIFVLRRRKCFQNIFNKLGPYRVGKAY